MSRHGHQKLSTSPGFVGKLTTSLLTFCLISFSTPVLGETKAYKPDERSGSSSVALNVSNGIVQCEEWASITGQTWDNIAGESYINAIVASNNANKILQETIFLDHETSIKTPEDYYKQVGSYLARVATCEIYARLTWAENYSNDNAEFFNNPQKDDSSSNSSSSALATCMSKSTAEEQQSCVQQAQSQQDLNCQYKGWETHDYLKCKEIITWLQGFTIGETAMQIQQTYRQGVQQNDAYEDLINKQNSDDGISVTDTLEHEQEAYEQKGNMAYEMAAYKASQAGILIALLDDFPNAEDMQKKCVANATSYDLSSFNTLYEKLIKPFEGESPLKEVISNVFEKNEDLTADQQKKQFESYLASYGGVTGQAADITDLQTEMCTHLVSVDNQFLLNTKVRDTMKQVAIEAGLAAIAQGANGALLHDQAEIIGDAIDEIEEYEEPEWAEATFTSSVSECLVDEDAEGCTLTSGTSSSGFGSQSFNSSLSGSAELGSGSITDGSGSGISSASATDRDTIADSFGSVQIGSASDNSFEDGTVRAGTIKGGAAGSGSGAGGGGGGAGSAGRPSGGGSNSNSGGGQLASSSKKSAVNIGRSGSGLGSIAGGRGSIGKKVSSSDNPFAKLLGKNSTASSSTLNFRTPSSEIGSSKGTIFQMISSRYKAVSESDKLIKYEEVEE